MKYLINLTYNGKDFYGYQIQNNKLTVEGELEKSLSKLLNEKINTIGCSRTDRGVHALDQYCTFETEKKINLKKLKYSLNSVIDKNIYIKKISKVSDDFNIRSHVVKKRYVYKINIGEYNPIEKDYVYQYNKNINNELIELFISKMNGEHNFRSFTSDKENNNYIRNIFIKYKKRQKVLYLYFESEGFLRYMIRNIVGLLIDINENKKSINDIDEIFKSKNRCSLGATAPGVGLYLEKIELKKSL